MALVGKPGNVKWVTNSGELATAKRYLAKRTDESFRGAATAHGNDLIRAAIALSRGNLSLSEQAKLKHPYATRFKTNYLAPARPDFLINVQTGRFANSWHWHLYKTTSAWLIIVWNDAPEARFMTGTKFERERPILKQARKLVDKRRIQLFHDVVNKAITENNAVGAPAPKDVVDGESIPGYVEMDALPGFATEIPSVARIEAEGGWGDGGGSLGAGATGIGALDSTPPILLAVLEGSSQSILTLVNALK